MTPSPLVTQMNDKRNFLPSEYDNIYKAKIKKERPKSSINTALRVFTQFVLTTNDNETQYEVTHYNKKTLNSIINKPHDSIGNLLRYKFADNYREQVNFI